MTTVAIDPRTNKPFVDDFTGEPITCLDEGDDCRGEIDYRPSLTGTGLAIPRCAFHWDKRLDKEDEHRAFEYWGEHVMDPADIGECWDDD